MNVDDYLTRIGAPRRPAPTANSLRELHRIHLENVPFENLDIHLDPRRPIRLTEEALVDKIVRRRRGGYCYELNGLFAIALRELGFEVALLSARPKVSVGNYGPEFDHMALLVTLERQRWLVDVGFGDCFLTPLLLDTTENQFDGRLHYRIEPQPMEHWLLRRMDEGSTWWEQYVFNLTQRRLEVFVVMNVFHQTSPRSHFARHKVVTRATAEGRVTLSDDRLITTRGMQQESERVPDRKRYAEILRTTFGIDPEDVRDLT